MKYNSVKGVEDILPPATLKWRAVEAAAGEVFAAYGYQELRPPVMEFTEVFTRSIGEASDIVEKEMYTFNDRAGRSITLRPEGTAPAVRCFVENRLYNMPAPQKFYYSGPMFRYERPQRGRQRQFYQIGVEAFGSAEPKIDAEIIHMLKLFLERAGLEGLSMEINSIGCKDCRPAHKEALINFFSPRIDALCEDCRRRYTQNPLRILDCKVGGCIEQRKGAPLVSDFLCGDCKGHFDELRRLLDALDVPYSVNPEMVRGLDYYTRTTFEVKSAGLGAQNSVAAGGRYDGLVGDFGGPPTPAIGFAVGMERLVSLIKKETPPSPALFIASLGEAASDWAFLTASRLRAGGLWVELGYEGGSLRSQMRRADRLGAEFLFIIGEDELKKGSAGWKNLKDGSTGEVALEEVGNFYKK